VAKVRVYELAKELGVESKTLLSHLKEQGEFVRSASSTIEPPVVRKVRESFPAELAAGGTAAAVKEGAATPAAKKPAAKPGAPAPAATVAPAAPAPVVAPAAPAPEAPITPAAAAPAAATAGVPRAPSRPVAPSPRTPSPRAPAAKAPAAKTPGPKTPASEAPAAREGGADTPRPAPRPGARAPGTTPLRRARACLEVAAKAASLGRAAKHRRLHVQATTPLLPARECPAHRVAVRLLPVPAVPALVPRARTRA